MISNTYIETFTCVNILVGWHCWHFTLDVLDSHFTQLQSFTIAVTRGPCVPGGQVGESTWPGGATHTGPGVLYQGGPRSHGEVLGLFTQWGTDCCLFGRVVGGRGALMGEKEIEIERRKLGLLMHGWKIFPGKSLTRTWSYKANTKLHKTNYGAHA